MSDSAETSRRLRGPRKFAEWVSLALSAVIIVILAGYLLFEAVTGSGPIVPAEARVRLDQISHAGERYVVPVEVSNRGERTMRDAKVEVTHRTAQQMPSETQDFTIDYLAERSSQTVYLYFDRDPAQLDVRATVLHYRLE